MCLNFFLSPPPKIITSSGSFAFGKSTGWKVPDKGKSSSHVIVSTALEISLMNPSAPRCTRPCPTTPWSSSQDRWVLQGAEQADEEGTGCPAWMLLGTSSVKGSFTAGSSVNFSSNEQQLSTEQGHGLQSCPCWTVQPVFRHHRSGSVRSHGHQLGTSSFSPRAGWLCGDSWAGAL